MPSGFSRSEISFRIRQVSTALRALGLWDEYGLTSLLYASKIPSKSKLEEQIRAARKPIRHGLTPALIAASVYQYLIERRPHQVRWDEAYGDLRIALNKIKPGREHAKKYHEHIAKILTASLDGHLTNPVVEQPLDQRRKFVDITFDNEASRGFFSNLKRSIKSEYIYVECKNYSLKLGNSEYDQLAGRLNNRRGMFGLLICRNVPDKNEALAQCLDRYNGEAKCIIVLDDGDITAIFKARMHGDISDAESVIKDKFRQLILGAKK